MTLREPERKRSIFFLSAWEALIDQAEGLELSLRRSQETAEQELERGEGNRAKPGEQKKGPAQRDKIPEVELAWEAEPRE